MTCLHQKSEIEQLERDLSRLHDRKFEDHSDDIVILETAKKSLEDTLHVIVQEKNQCEILYNAIARWVELQALLSKI